MSNQAESLPPVRTDETGEDMTSQAYDEQAHEMQVQEETVQEDMPQEETVQEDAAAETQERYIEQIAELRARIAELEELQRAQERIACELDELAAYFPQVTPDSIPQSVWERARAGSSLAASYALYHRQLQLDKERAELVNDINARRSAGAIGGVTEEFFTPDDVRRMSAAQVHANYSRIKESMKKWGE